MQNDMAEQQRGKRGEKVRFLFRYSKGYRICFITALAATLLSTVFSFLTPQVIKVTIDSVIDSNPYQLPVKLALWLEQVAPREYLRENLWIPAVVTILFALFSTLTNFQRRYNIALFAEGTIRNLRNRLFDLTQRLPYEWHIRIQTGDIIQRCTSDLNTIQAFLSQQLIELIRVIVMIVVASYMMISIHMKLALAALAFLPFIAGYSVFFFKKAGDRFLMADEAEGEVMTVVQENLTGVRVVRAFGREGYEREKFNRYNERYTALWMRLGNLMGLYWGIGDLATGLQNTVILGVGVYTVVQGNGLHLGGLIALLTYNSYLVWPVRSLGRILSDMSRNDVSIQRIREILDAEPERDDEDAQAFEFQGDLAFEHVSFGYDGELVLKDISFTAKAGQTLAILGSTGSGKSTIAHLLPRLYDLPEGQGRILIDGVDIRKITRACLRSQVGIVLQEPFPFSRTIEENIRGASSELSLERIREAANIAAVDKAILSFEKGYETIVGERGVTLSGGQKQRVAIARMLAQNPRIMIFDDSLSAVDTETDAQIRAALKQRAGRATTLLISHRAVTLMQADCIMVLDGGKIVQMGTHNQLMQEDGLYRRVCRIQMDLEETIHQQSSAEAAAGEEVQA